MIIFTKKFEGKWNCRYDECGAKCCHQEIFLTEEDIKRIEKCSGKKREEFVAGPAKHKGLYMMKAGKKGCFFLEANSCTLQKTDAKPVYCLMLPFRFDGIDYGDELIMKVTPILEKECPGYGKDKVRGREFYERLEKLGKQFVREIQAGVRKKK